MTKLEKLKKADKIFDEEIDNENKALETALEGVWEAKEALKIKADKAHKAHDERIGKANDAYSKALEEIDNE